MSRDLKERLAFINNPIYYRTSQSKVWALPLTSTTLLNEKRVCLQVKSDV